jgi:hypothetical protein
MKPLTVTLVVLGVVFDGWLSSGQSQEPKQDRNPIMQLKLSHAQKVLEGIALNDFNLIEKHADELIILSNKAEWKVLPTRDYLLQSNEFRRNAELLTKAAKGKNLDGATLAYVQLTMSCVSCHKHVREVRMARLD